MSIHYGFGANWDNVSDAKMEKTELGFQAEILLSDEETLLKRDKQRPEDCQMNQRCLILLNSFKNKDYKQERKKRYSKVIQKLRPCYIRELFNITQPKHIRQNIAGKYHQGICEI